MCLLSTLQSYELKSPRPQHPPQGPQLRDRAGQGNRNQDLQHDRQVQNRSRKGVQYTGRRASPGLLQYEVEGRRHIRESSQVTQAIQWRHDSFVFGPSDLCGLTSLLQYFQNMNEEETEILKASSEEKRRFRPSSPPPLTNKIRRPWKGIFLVWFLFFAGLLFFYFGYDHYDKYTVWEVAVVWFLSILLLIPGVYFSAMIVSIELGFGGLTYEAIPQLNN